MTVGFLASYAYFRTIDMREFKKRLMFGPLFADSGAYTAHTTGRSISVQNYARWLWKWHDVFDVSVNLDVIKDSVGSEQNLETLRTYGLNPVPVFHNGLSIDDIKREVDKGCSYIALGGLTVRKDAGQALVWIDSVFNAVPREVKIHGFGFTKFQYMLEWPWASVDSSSWVAGARYNSVMLFDAPGFVRCKLNEPECRRKHASLLQAHGADLDRFLRGKFHYKDTFGIGALAMWRASEYWSLQARKRGWIDPTLYLASVENCLISASRAIRNHVAQNA